MNDNPLIVALDHDDAAAALAMAERLDPAGCRVKIGNILFTRAGPPLIEALHRLGFQVFLDLKYHDIPNTVAGACRAACDLGVWMLNVHAGGGPAMLEAASEAVRASGHPALLIAVTVLTSLDDADLGRMGVGDGAEAQVRRLARLAADGGCDGVVCSAREIEMLRAAHGHDFKLVTPGIRPAGSASSDQKRIVTPAAALAAGASYLVIGRPVTAADEPLQALQAIQASIAAAAGT